MLRDVYANMNLNILKSRLIAFSVGLKKGYDVTVPIASELHL